MRQNVSAGLKALLNDPLANALFVADLYTFTLQNGTVARFTSLDQDLVVSGQTFVGSTSTNGLKITRDRMTLKLGIEVGQLKVTVAPGASTLQGVPWLQAIRNGALDGATVVLDRLVTDTWADLSRGAIGAWFAGRVGPITCGKFTADLTLRDPLVLLNIQMPRNLYQTGCQHALYDVGCALSKAEFAAALSINTTPTTMFLPCVITQGAGYFDLGTITFTSGVNNGVTRTVRQNTTQGLSLVIPLYALPAIGDTFNAYPGCDKTQSTCASGKFNNLANFRGMPYVPVPETIL